jgi:23S rRNA pseudouridine2605 synthase
MALVEHACKEHILPVGRLDRNTTGLLLFTNDGDMAKKLTHPSGNIRKVYHIYLDKVLTKKDLLDIADGIELDDGFIKPDVITYVGNGDDKKEIGMELHSGRNRIVRRIFEQLGYEVVKLDRVIFANLTKKDLRRGHHRFLTEQEVAWLKML